MCMYIYFQLFLWLLSFGKMAKKTQIWLWSAIYLTQTKPRVMCFAPSPIYNYVCLSLFLLFLISFYVLTPLSLSLILYMSLMRYSKIALPFYLCILYLILLISLFLSVSCILYNYVFFKLYCLNTKDIALSWIALEHYIL